MSTGAQVAFTAASQAGDPYVFGAEASPSNPNPRAFDCSELVEWACARLGVSPRMPDGSKAQKAHCQRHNTLISVQRAIDTRGALLFRMTGNPTHVAISRGGGQTIEAKGRAYGTGIFSAHGRGWTHGALIPGVEYGDPVPVPVNLLSKRDMARAAVWPVGSMPDLNPGDVSLHVIWLQRGLNITAGFGLKDDGHYGDRTTLAVIAFQRWFNVTQDPLGAAHRFTRFYLHAALENVRDGKA